MGFFVSILFCFITIRLTDILPKINKATNSNKKMVKNKVLLLINKYPEIIKISTKIRYSDENEMFCFIKPRPEISVVNSIISNKKKYVSVL
jgi:hypothetical protein